MKTELRLAPHSTIPGANIIEVRHNGAFIGQVTGADGPGIRLVSKHLVKLEGPDIEMVDPMVLEIRLRPKIRLRPSP